MEKQTNKEAYQKFTVKDGTIEGVSKESVPKGTGEFTSKKKTVPDWLKERWEAGNNFNKEIVLVILIMR
ncbi:hypothetical protein [Peribacillus phoenicis]|uniref:hypothetical protein n=1 Tax=Peribacillus sp. 1P06PA-2 TaxID=3132295 RepID=UPI0039A640CB